MSEVLWHVFFPQRGNSAGFGERVDAFDLFMVSRCQWTLVGYRYVAFTCRYCQLFSLVAQFTCKHVHLDWMEMTKAAMSYDNQLQPLWPTCHRNCQMTAGSRSHFFLFHFASPPVAVQFCPDSACMISPVSQTTYLRYVCPVPSGLPKVRGDGGLNSALLPDLLPLLDSWLLRFSRMPSFGTSYWGLRYLSA